MASDEKSLDSQADQTEGRWPMRGLFCDLDANHGVTVEDGAVVAWTSRAPGPLRVFEGRRPDGRPTLLDGRSGAGGRCAVRFFRQELVHYDEDAFDRFTTGSGHTWLAVIAMHEQQAGGVKDVHAFFGNLRNGPRYEGFWAGVDDGNGLWAGPRNGRSFGRWNADNPKLEGPRLSIGRFHAIAGRLHAGVGPVAAELFVDGMPAVAREDFPVDPQAKPSKMTVGQERDATDHPGLESFVGEIARLAFWDVPLSDAELGSALAYARREYRLDADPPPGHSESTMY